MTARLNAGGTIRLAQSVSADATTLELDTTDGWTTAGGDYPVTVRVGGELITVALVGISTITGRIQLAGCTRSVNGVVKEHLSGALVEPADGLRLGLGWAGIPALTGTTPTPAPPPTGTHTVQFRTWASPGADPNVAGVAATPTLANLEHPSGGTIYAGGAGTSHRVSTSAEWDTAVAAAAPGDMIIVDAQITSSLMYRGSKYSIPGSNSLGGGAAGNPIVIGCEGAGEINVAALINNTAALRIENCDHVWVVGARTRGSQFGVFFRNWGGTATHPARFAHSDVADTGHAAVSVAGWFQAITSSGGTAPAGSGNEWGFSQHFVVENNLIDNPGLAADQFGECLYLGHGGTPGWISYAKDGIVRWNDLRRCKADYFDVKPGCHRIYAYDNTGQLGYFVSGAALQLLYVATSIADRPAWYDFDPEIHIEGWRIWDGNLTNSNGSSSNYLAQASLAGIRFVNNVGWGFNGGIMFRLRSEKAASQSQSSDSEQWIVANNTGWIDVGLDNVGAPAASPTAFSAGLIDARNNLGPTGGTGFTHTAAGTAFVDPAAIPTVDTVDADAQWLTYGPGSAFDLDPDDALVGAGSSISDLTFHVGQDISQRGFPVTSPNPGAFQPHPANIPS